jgi:glycosyltransferase involved in cell wall biosynthesis
MTEAPTASPNPATAAPAPDEPSGVSIIMTVLNEERHLHAAVRAILEQDYPGPMELVIARGPSTDRTDAIVADLAAADARVGSVPNPSGATPVGLNLAVTEAVHDIVVRVDGHAVLPETYVRTAVEVLEETEADNVGGIMAAEGTTPFEQAVACAMTSRLGVGAARFHVGGEAGPAETVYLGAFRRAALERVGRYDESLRRAQDWELNYRIRRSGGTVWFTPEMRVSYRPRGDPASLARQYFRTGQWRRAVSRKHAGPVGLRYLAPPAALLGFAAGLATGLAGYRPAFLLPAGYAALILAGSAITGAGRPRGVRLRLPLAYATMHASWGLGFLASPRELG